MPWRMMPRQSGYGITLGVFVLLPRFWDTTIRKIGAWAVARSRSEADNEVWIKTRPTLEQELE